jgi:hypothetical protein
MEERVEALRHAALGLFTEAQAEREYEIAYHALCAALHAAESLGDPQTCRLVASRAGECRDWIDLHAPRHKLSTRSAQARGHESIFRQLSMLAEAAHLRLAGETHKKQGRP